MSSAAIARSSVRSPPAAALARVPRSDNRMRHVLDTAARLFRERGFDATSMRDIAEAAGMQAGSLYYHFANKEELLASVYAEGVRRISTNVRAALARPIDPWSRLEAACVAHLEALLGGGDYSQVVIRVRPEDAPGVAARLRDQRDEYERLIVPVIARLPLTRGTDRTLLRMMLLGALNWTPTWYRKGAKTPRRIAREFVRTVRAGTSLSGGHSSPIAG